MLETSYALQQSASALLASAVLDLIPRAIPLCGGALRAGFYYEFFLPQPLTKEFLKVIEERMAQIVREARPIETLHMVAKNAAEYLRHHGFKERAKMVGSLGEEVVDVVRMGQYIDLSQGPHVASSALLRHFSLLSWEEVGGAVRVKGAVFEGKEALKKFIKQFEEEKKWGHLPLGERLDLYFVQEDEVYWKPKGQALRLKLQSYLRKTYQESGFYEVKTPSSSLMDHLKLYRKAQPVFELGERGDDEEKLRLGLFQPAHFSFDEGRFFCHPDQLRTHVLACMTLMKQLLNKFSMPVRFVVQKPSEKRTNACTNFSFQALCEALEVLGFEGATEAALTQKQAEASIVAFLSDPLGREWQVASLLLHSSAHLHAMKKELGCDDGQGLCGGTLSLFGKLERVLALLLETHKGQLPSWLDDESL